MTLIYKRMIIAGATALVVGGAGLSMYSHAEESPAAGEAEATPFWAEEPTGQADEQTMSYALGFRVGMDFAQRGIELDAEAFTEGAAAALAGQNPRLSEQELTAGLRAFQAQMQERQREQLQEIARQSEAFIEEKRQEEGVQATESGLLYRVIEEGEGESPAATDQVVVHYRGNFVNGQQFDSSFESGQPAVFQVDGVIPGWTEALQLMKPGARWELYIPSDLAYGPQGMVHQGQQVMPPNAALIFEVHLIEVQEAE